MTSEDWQITVCGLCGTSELCRIFRFPAAGWRVPLCASCVPTDPTPSAPPPAHQIDTDPTGAPMTPDQIRRTLAELRRTLDMIATDLDRQRTYLADTLAGLRKKTPRNP